MWIWMVWLTQYYLGKLFLALSLTWMALGWWRWWQCRSRLSGLDLPPLLPPLLAAVAPFLLMQGFTAGWDRLDRELSNLTGLEPWEGLRAIEIVRHALNSFWNWSVPPASAGAMALVCALLLSLAHLLWSFDLYLHRRRKKPDQLEELRHEIQELKQLVMLQMQRSPEALPQGFFPQLPPGPE